MDCGGVGLVDGRTAKSFAMISDAKKLLSACRGREARATVAPIELHTRAAKHGGPSSLPTSGMTDVEGTF